MNASQRLILAALSCTAFLSSNSLLSAPLLSNDSTRSVQGTNVDFDAEPDTVHVPYDGFDLCWQNGNDRRTHSVLQSKYFRGSVMLDVNYNYSFNNPIDNTVVGSTAVARSNELQLSYLGFGGDFDYRSAHARLMTQFGTRAIVVPRNDYSPYRGQYQLADAYRYISEGYAGFHINKWYGINVDFGLFMSYIGLNSYYQAENWEYQASFTSDNTPWFFNGMRIQIYPGKTVKIEPWIINGWQSYGKFNSMPGFGANFTWMPNERFKILTNDYYGTDVAGIAQRKRFHSDNSLQYRYFNKQAEKGASRAAFSVTFDLGFEQGGGVQAFGSDSAIPAQHFISAMVYHRLWFHHNKFAWTIGGGVMSNPGRYLVLYPSGQASPLPKPDNPTQTEGAFPFSANPGDKFNGWDASTNFDWLPNQSLCVRLEYVHRASDVPYFAGRGGITSPNGYSTQLLPADWRPDLVNTEDRIILAILFRL